MTYQSSTLQSLHVKIENVDSIFVAEVVSRKSLTSFERECRKIATWVTERPRLSHSLEADKS
jgi:hypothetical protein